MSGNAYPLLCYLLATQYLWTRPEIDSRWNNFYNKKLSLRVIFDGA